MAASCCSEDSRHELQASFIDSYVSETSFFSGCSSRTSFFVESLKPLIRTSRLRTKSPIVWHFWYTWERNFPCDNMARLLVPYLTLYNNELGQPANKSAKVGKKCLPNTKNSYKNCPRHYEILSIWQNIVEKTFRYFTKAVFKFKPYLSSVHFLMEAKLFSKIKPF